MKQLAITISILLLASFAAQGLIVNPIDYKDTDKAYNDYVELLRQHDVFITLPQNYTPVNIRGLSDVKISIGSGIENLSIDCMPTDIEAIVEDDSCRVAICYPQVRIIFPGESGPHYTWSTHGSRGIESDLRMVYDNMNLDVRDKINIIAEEDMSRYANADTVAFYEFNMPGHNFMDNYTKGIGIYLRKKNHPSMLLRVMYNQNSLREKDRLIREALDNIRYGDNPSEYFVELEKKSSGQSDFSFPTKYRVFTGILANINDETLDELNRIKAWCEEHGMKELPKVDDAMLDALNRARESRRKENAAADSIITSNIPDDKKIFLPRMCDTPALFPGEDEVRNKYWDWLEKNINYPKKAADKGIEGNVWVNFTVCADGSIKDVSISEEQSKDQNELLKREAIRLFESMPRWTPATYNGKPVNTREMRLIRFALPEGRMSPMNAVDPEKTRVYYMHEVPVAPKFKGGNEELGKWIQDHIQYPLSAAKEKIEGRVIVEFVITREGFVSAPRVVRGISDALNKEALRVIRSLPQWTPGYSNGKPVHTRYTYPVAFKLAKAK